MLRRSTIREIKKNLGRYLAILSIVALGVGFFSGLRITKPAMVDTAQEYLNEHRLYDFELISTLGFENKDIKNISSTDGIHSVEGSVSSDVIIHSDKNTDNVVKALSITDNINVTKLESGRMPKKNFECIADSRMYTESDIGKKIVFSESNSSDTIDMFKYQEYTIVGICESPLYMNFERGSTSLGNGSLSGFFYINYAGFNVDYYTEVYVKINENFPLFSSDYDDAVDTLNPSVTAACRNSADRRYNQVVNQAEDKLEQKKKEYELNSEQYITQKNATYAKLTATYNKILNSKKKLTEEKNKLTESKKSLKQSQIQIAKELSDLKNQREQFEAKKPYMTEDEINQTQLKLDGMGKKLEESQLKIDLGLSQVANSEKKLISSEKALSSSTKEYYSAKNMADSKFADAKANLDEGKMQLDKAQQKINKIKKPSTYVLTRNENLGYACFYNDSDIVAGIGKVFPIFFFLVAALVCMTTMTRMVEEQRTQIGVFKALGYSNVRIMASYLSYAGSAAIIGCILGFLGGCYLFPAVIWKAYSIMYDFSGSIHYIINWKLAVICIIVSLICSVGATLFSCLNDFRIVPAQLIRPKSPRSGKRILLEYITPLWNRIGFLYKVSLRNIFRYKKRFFMMILGISGCTALLLTGLGLNDSIKNIVNFQYDEITTYDYSVTFNSDQNQKEQSKFISDTSDFSDSVIFVHEGSADYVKGKTVKSIKLIVSDNPDFSKFIDLHTLKEHIPYPKNGQAVICEKLANEYNIKAGDIITLRDSSRNTMKINVSNICKNYIYNYIYVTPQTCKNGWGYIPEYKTAYINCKKGSESTIYKAAAKTQELESVVGTNINMNMKKRVNNMMKSMNAVILLVIFSAGALAFIVLYNLTNINITERIREIATIKVLGFYPVETSAYVFRENFFLTGISAFVGLILGKWLDAFVMSQIKIDLISFDVRITPVSYMLSVVLTFVFAAVVAFAMYFKLKKISMTESLKSIE